MSRGSTHLPAWRAKVRAEQRVWVRRSRYVARKYARAAPNACEVLMKVLWLVRLARPDMIKPMGDWTTQVQSWTCRP